MERIWALTTSILTASIPFAYGFTSLPLLPLTNQSVLNLSPDSVGFYFYYESQVNGQWALASDKSLDLVPAEHHWYWFFLTWFIFTRDYINKSGNVVLSEGWGRRWAFMEVRNWAPFLGEITNTIPSGKWTVYHVGFRPWDYRRNLLSSQPQKTKKSGSPDLAKTFYPILSHFDLVLREIGESRLRQHMGLPALSCSNLCTLSNWTRQCCYELRFLRTRVKKGAGRIYPKMKEIVVRFHPLPLRILLVSSVTLRCRGTGYTYLLPTTIKSAVCSWVNQIISSKRCGRWNLWNIACVPRVISLRKGRIADGLVLPLSFRNSWDSFNFNWPCLA